MVLRNMPDLATLSALVHASPWFHANYTAHRDELLTLITLRDLEAHYIAIELPSPGHNRWCRISTRTYIDDPSAVVADDPVYNDLFLATRLCELQKAKGEKRVLGPELCVKLQCYKRMEFMQFFIQSGDGLVVECGDASTMSSSEAYRIGHKRLHFGLLTSE